MMNQQLFTELNEKLKSVMAQGPMADFDRNVRAAIGSVLGRLELVTREEFDIQRELLQRTQQQLVALERKVSELEQARKSA
jgi:BMFP domain-containing protein YqiC